MRRSSLVAAVAVPLVLAAVLGALGGWLWWTWWGPAPKGQVYDTPNGPTWFPNPFDPGVARDFSGTATYVVLGFGLALVLGVAGAVIARHRAIAGLVAVGVASVAGAALMAAVGLSQSPPDPQDKVHRVAVGTRLPGHLHVASADIDLFGVHLHLPTPYLAWPVGALLGYLVVMLSLGGRSGPPAPTSGAPGPQD